MLKMIKKNDTKDVINYQLLDDDGSPVNLAGATVNFVMGKKNKLITNSPAIVTAANDGIVEYPLTITDTLVSGTFLAEFVVTFSNGEQKTFPNNGYITVNVEQNLDTNQTNVVVDMLAAKQGDFEAKLNSILQLNNINVTAMGEYTWTATEGQLVYTMPSTTNYTVDSKWFQVYVGNIPIDPSLVNRLNNTQFSFIVESSYIKAGMKISARWTEPVVPLNIGSELTAMNEWTWTATNGQLVYSFPENANYKLSSKWFQVYVDNMLVDASLVQRLTDTQFSLNIDPSYIEAGMHVLAQWTESVIPFTGGHRSTHELGGQDPIDITQLTGYQENVATPLADTVTIKPSGVNDTLTWNNGVNKLTSGGQLNLTHGDYYIDGGLLKSNIVIHGRGFPRILSDSYMFVVNSGSPDITNNINNITFEYVVFEAITKTFSQYIHQLILSGVSNITFKECVFKGFRGDGVYLGSGDSGQERHNENIHFDKCIFDGVNFQNRNGISVIDGDGVHIHKCIFKNTTQPNMPGAIDIEPNANNWHIVKNITVKKCKFKNIGGNTGAIGMYLPLAQDQLLTPVENIEFSGNVINGTTDTESGFFVRQTNSADITKATNGLKLKIKNNYVSGTSNFGAFITGVRDIEIKGNSFKNNKNGVIIGSNSVGSKVIDVRVNGNNFSKPTVGGIGGGLTFYSVEDVDIVENIFNDCYASSIVFNTGTSKFVKIVRNTFLSPTGNTLLAIEKKSDHTFNPSTNIDKDNIFDGVTSNFFQSFNKDFIVYSDLGGYDTTKLPDSFALGEEISVVNGDTNLPSAYKQGILKTIKPTLTSGYRKFIVQWFYPANNDATTIADMYFRKANGATNDWSAWKKVTGV